MYCRVSAMMMAVTMAMRMAMTMAMTITLMMAMKMTITTTMAFPKVRLQFTFLGRAAAQVHTNLIALHMIQEFD